MSETDHTLEVPAYEGDITNWPLVGARGDAIVFVNPQAILVPIPNEQALVLAAYIVAIADRSENYTLFRSILKAVLQA